jgi:hypothetical protein
MSKKGRRQQIPEFFEIDQIPFYTVRMKTQKLTLGTVTSATVLVLLVLLTGCTTLGMLTDDAIGKAVGTRISAKTGEVEFQIVYAQTMIFSAGGTSVNDFKPGEGVRWQLTWDDSDDQPEPVESEHALLTRDAEGEWWYIALFSDSSTVEYEYFVNAEDVVTQLFYRNSDMPESRTMSVSIPLDRENEGGFGYLYDEITADESGSYTVTRTTERVTVPAGTFKADKVAVTGTDEETGEKVDATWWFVDDVPGKMVRYEFYSEDDEVYKGHLLKVGRDYRRRL